MRIATLLPSATEIAFAVGAGPEVVGVSHECDWPAEARGLPVLTGPAVDTRGLSQAAIDAAIASLLAAGGSTYHIDVPRLRALRPDLVVTQALCDVCAVSEGQVHRVVHEEQLGARVLTLTPLNLEGVARSVEQVGEASGHAAGGARLAAGMRERLAEPVPARGPRPRVVALEWFDPPFAAGHWVPEQIALAGGEDALGRPGEKSERVTWEAIAAARPDVALLLPCGLTLDEAAREASTLAERPEWRALPTVARGAVWALDASAWFSRPGPRLLDGVEALRAILADPAGDRPVAGARRPPPRPERVPLARRSRTMGRMQCPRDAVDLVVEHHEGIEVDHCPACNGRWLDHHELDELEARTAPDESQRRAMIEYARRESELACPVCGKRMWAFNYRAYNLELDTCEDEHGFWVDAGEEGRIRDVMEERVRGLNRAVTAEQAWGEFLRGAGSGSMWDQISGFFRGRRR